MFSRWHSRLRSTLGFRLAVWYAAVFTASTAGLTLLTYALLARSLEQRDHDSVATTLTEYAREYANGGLARLAPAIERAQRDGRHERLFVRVISRAGTSEFISAPPEWGEFEIGDPSSGDMRGGDAFWQAAPSQSGDARLEIASTLLPDGTLLQVGKSTESRDELLRRFRSLLGGVALLIVLLGVGGGVLVTRSSLRPVRRLAAAIRSIIETGQTEVRVPVERSGDPLDDLGALVNTMLDRITHLMEGMRESLDNVAHDLRTPLARLRARAEAALATGDPAVRDEALADCIAEADRISATLTTLMDIAEARTGTLPLRVIPIHVARIVEDVVELYEDAARAQHVSLVAQVPEDVVVTGDEARLRQVIANLVDNGIKYTGSGGQVRITAAKRHTEVAIIVEDTGPGIPLGDLPRIWDRLYRGDRSRSTRGLGLGLSVVKAFVEAHGGRVTAENLPNGGAMFAVYLPLHASAGPSARTNLSAL